MITDQSSWIGKILDDVVIDELIGEDPISWIYKAVNQENRAPKAVRIAKPKEKVDLSHRNRPMRTQALTFIPGGVIDIHPDPRELLLLQATKLEKAADPCLVAVENIVDRDFTYSITELVTGGTLRQKCESGPLPIAVMVELADCLYRLSCNTCFQYHGDLKPDHILIADQGIKLLSPGYFGPLHIKEATLRSCVVTTPAYYPLLVPDDLLAFGILLWEVTCKSYPLGGHSDSGVINKSNLGEALVQWVEEKELVGQYYLTPILETGLPSKTRPGLPAALESLLLKAMNLQIRSDGKIDRRQGFTSFDQISTALRGLQALDIDEL